MIFTYSVIVPGTHDAQYLLESRTWRAAVTDLRYTKPDLYPELPNDENPVGFLMLSSPVQDRPNEKGKGGVSR